MNRAWELRNEIAHLKLGKPSTIGDALGMIGRRKDREWLGMVLECASRGMALDDALEQSTRVGYENYANAKQSLVMEKARQKLKQPDICHAMEAVFEVRGFTMQDAVDMQVAHIKGEITKEVLTKVRDAEGNESVEISAIKEAPSYPALRDYFKLVLPPPTKQVQVASINVNEMLRTMEQQTIEGGSVETVTAPRLVGDVLDTDPQENEDDIDPYEDEPDEDDEQEPDEDEDDGD